MISSPTALKVVRQYVDACGSQKEAAKHLGISAQFLCDVLQGHKQPYSIMEKLGWERVIFYKRKSEQSKDAK